MNVFDEIYFKRLFYDYYDKVYSGFLKKTANEAVSQDLAQITFIKLWEYRSAFNFDMPEELQINRKAKLVFIDWLRKEAYQRKLIKEMENYSAAITKPEKFELTDRLQFAINELSAARKKVFTMAYIEGYSHKEIASILGISVRTVDNHILKSLAQLRKILAYQAVLGIIIFL